MLSDRALSLKIECQDELQRIIRDLPKVTGETKATMESRKWELVGKIHQLHQYSESHLVAEVCTTPGCGNIDQIRRADLARFAQGYRCSVCLVREVDPSIFA